MWRERGPCLKFLCIPHHINILLLKENLSWPSIILKHCPVKCISDSSRGVQPFGVSGPHWNKSCLGPHIKYIETRNHKKSHDVLSKFMILCWATFTSILA